MEEPTIAKSDVAGPVPVGGIRATVVVPVYNERKTLPDLTKAIHDIAMGSPRIESIQIVLVDDGSTDDSWAVIAGIAERDPDVTAIRLRRNFGKATALDVGLRHAKTEIVITMDADLQDDPREIPNFLSKLDEGYDVVSGWKVDRQDRADKVLPSKVFNFVTALLTGVKLKDMNCGFKAYRREVFDSIRLYGELHRYIPVLADAAGYRVGEIPVRHRPRKFGTSKYGWKRYGRGFLDLLTTLMITRYDRRPGHLFGGFGLLLTFAGLAVLTYLSAIKLFLGAPIGTRPLLQLGVVLLIVGGQLLFFGMMAELIIHRTEPQMKRGVIAQIVKGSAVDAAPPARDRKE